MRHLGRLLLCMITTSIFFTFTSSDSAALSSSETGACLEGAVPHPKPSKGEPLRELVTDVLSRCFAKRGSPELEDQAKALPFALAVHAPTNKEVRLIYFCSDICPTYGRVFATLADVSEPECCTIGQIPLHDSAWGGYLGCSPVELASDYDKNRRRCERPEDATRKIEPKDSPQLVRTLSACNLEPHPDQKAYTVAAATCMTSHGFYYTGIGWAPLKSATTTAGTQ